MTLREIRRWCLLSCATGGVVATLLLPTPPRPQPQQPAASAEVHDTAWFVAHPDEMHRTIVACDAAHANDNPDCPSAALAVFQATFGKTARQK